MQRSIVVLLILVLTALGAAIWWFSREEASLPTPGPVATGAAEAGDASQAHGGPSLPREASSAPDHREEVAAVASQVLDDPEIVAALTGFRGRVVTHTKQPVPDCGVRMYRGAMDVVLLESVDLFAEEPTLVPQYVAGETRTAADGTFLISGVWPRAFYILFAGIGTDAPMHQVVTRTPSPGEVVDLGDVVLPDAGVIVGTVLDDDGEPLAGALVRAADLPGSLAAFFPVERFDPAGAVLIREANAPVRVVEMPAWVKAAFEHLPIPSTRTDGEGKFRLVGVIPGSNLLATTAKDYLSDVKPSLQVRAGQVKDAGKIKLKRGEELMGRVVDDAGKAIAGAEVLAGSTLSMVPFDLAQRLGTSDAEGRFQGQGFSPGKVTIAARRGKGHAWVLAEPQAVLGEVVVTLPTTHAAAVTVLLADGKPAKDPRFKLLLGRAGDGAAEMAVFGFVPPIDLRDRQKLVAEGQWRIENLAVGKYTLVADAPGHATAFETFEIAAADVAVTLQLTTKKDFPVRVLSLDDKPIRNAAIVAEASGKQLFDMPVHCGRTKADGRLVIDKIQADTLRVSADHPRWGVVHGEAKLGEELVLRMQPPGSLHGILTENGKPPDAGKYTIGVHRERGDGPRGPIETVPMLYTAGLDGSFTVAALQPGRYSVVVIKAIDALHSPGGVMAFSQEMFMSHDMPHEQVEVVAAETAEVRLDAGQKPLEGPTAHLFGNVTIDGKLAVGHTITAHSEQRRFHAKVDESGRFDLGTVPASPNLWVSVMAGSENSFFGGGGSANVWSGTVKLAEAEERELTIVVNTSSVSGTCYLPDGRPATGIYVQAQGKLKNSAENQGQVWLGAPTNAQGHFEFKQVAEGTWSFEAHGNGENNGRGKLEGIVVEAGIPLEALRIDMHKTMVVKGRLDLASFGTKKPRWCWIGFHHMPKDGGDGVGDWGDSAGVDQENGEFSSDDMKPGNYRVRIHASFGDNEHAEYHCQDIEVPPQGLENLVLRIGAPVTQGR